MTQLGMVRALISWSLRLWITRSCCAQPPAPLTRQPRGSSAAGCVRASSISYSGSTAAVTYLGLAWSGTGRRHGPAEPSTVRRRARREQESDSGKRLYQASTSQHLASQRKCPNLGKWGTPGEATLGRCGAAGAHGRDRKARSARASFLLPLDIPGCCSAGITVAE